MDLPRGPLLSFLKQPSGPVDGQFPSRPQQPRWFAPIRSGRRTEGGWNYEPAVIDALGEDIYRSIVAAVAEEPLDDLVAWAAGSEI
jgi:hypothetical protein